MQDERQPGFNNRIDYLDTLFRAYPRSWLSANVFFEQMAQRFVKSRVGFNISIKRDLNMRVFEIMSTGTALLTNRNVEGLEDLFTEDQDFFGYENLEDLEAAADKVMMLSQLERDLVASSALHKVRSQHTYKHRMQTIVEGLKTCR
jgi:spore maturation protein CgeB